MDLTETFSHLITGYLFSTVVYPHIPYYSRWSNLSRTKFDWGLIMKERIKSLCELRRITFSQLEKELHFANGSLAKSDEKIQSARLKAIADYFGVSMEYLLTGYEKSDQKYAISNFEYQIILKIRNLEPSVRKYILGSLGMEEPDGERAADGSENIAV